MDALRQDTSTDALLLPKVSVIIVNYNYRDYLETAYESVAAQTYPNTEILIVDDKSTDDSCELIDKICAKNKSVIPVKLAKNGGQSVACLAGLSASSGGYLVLLDADDQLFPECVETHIYAHLSSRVPVAFTTVDILNHTAGQDINMSHAGFSAFVESGVGRRPASVRPIDESMPDSWFGQRPPAVTAEQMHFVLPPHADPWVWSPTSANCFRRDAVQLLLKEPGLERLRWGTDAYLMRPLSGLFGSLLLDRPLVRYVIHAKNRFARGAPMNNLRFFDPRTTADDIRIMARIGLEKLMSDVAANGHLYSNPRLFFDTIKVLTECWPGPNPSEAPGEYFGQLLMANEQALTVAFGKDTVAHVFRTQLSAGQKQRRLLRKVKVG